MSTVRLTAVSAKTGGRRDNGESHTNSALEADGHSLRPHPPAEPLHPSTLDREKQTRSKDQIGDTHSSRGPAIDSSRAEISESDGAEGEITQSDDDNEEQSVVDMLKGVEIGRGEERNRRGSEDVENETTYLYSSHPKSASNLMV